MPINKAIEKKNKFFLFKKTSFENLFINYFIFFITFFLIIFILTETYKNNPILIFIYLSFFCIFFSVTLYNPENGLLFFILILPFYHVVGIFFNTSRFLTILFMFLGFFIGTCFYIFKEKELLIDYKYPVSKPLIFFIILITISFIFVYLRVFDYLSFYKHLYREYIVNIDLKTSNDAIWSAIYQYFNYICGFLILFLLIKIKLNKSFYNSLFYVLFVSVNLVLIGCIYQIFVNPYFMGQSTGIGSQSWIGINTFANRYGSTLIDPNSLGIYSVIMIIFFISYISFYFSNEHHEKKQLNKKTAILKVFSIIGITECLILTFLSGSRTAFLGIMAIFSVYFFIIIKFVILKVFQKNIFKKNQIGKNISNTTICNEIDNKNYSDSNGIKLKKKNIINNSFKIYLVTIIVYCLIILIFIISFIFFISKSNNNLIPTTLQRLKIDTLKILSGDFKSAILDIFSGRLILWKVAFNILKDHPISGLGIGMFTIEMPNFGYLYGFDTMIRDLADNYYLQVATELGLFSLIIILWFFAIVLFEIKKIFKNVYIEKNIKNFSLNLYLVIPCMLLMFLFGPHTYFMEISFLFYFSIGLFLRNCQNSNFLNLDNDNF